MPKDTEMCGPSCELKRCTVLARSCLLPTDPASLPSSSRLSSSSVFPYRHPSTPTLLRHLPPLPSRLVHPYHQRSGLALHSGRRGSGLPQCLNDSTLHYTHVVLEEVHNSGARHPNREGVVAFTSNHAGDLEPSWVSGSTLARLGYRDSKKVAVRKCLAAGYVHHPLRPSRGRPSRDLQQKTLTAVVKVHNQNRHHFGCYSSSHKTNFVLSELAALRPCGRSVALTAKLNIELKI
ncbi:hypothetical protein IMY05_C1152002100 [Salix suchowensis]|nr:hypothetical protein IMY05_C1152002100 [Salix suchowensis]